MDVDRSTHQRSAVIWPWNERRTTRALPIALLALGSCIVWSARNVARAYEDQISLDVGLGYGWAPASECTQHGPNSMLGLGLGMGDEWTIRFWGGYALGLRGDDPITHVALLGAEALYALDVLRVVPQFGLSTQWLGSFKQGELDLDVGVGLVGGLDYFVERDFVVGLDLRAYVVPWSTGHGRFSPTYLVTGLRATWLFDRESY